MSNIGTIFNEVMEYAPEPLRDALERDMDCWAPEVFLDNLRDYVEKYVSPDSSNLDTIKIYAAINDCSEEEIKARFEKNGF